MVLVCLVRLMSRKCLFITLNIKQKRLVLVGNNNLLTESGTKCLQHAFYTHIIPHLFSITHFTRILSYVTVTHMKRPSRTTKASPSDGQVTGFHYGNVSLLGRIFFLYRYRTGTMNCAPIRLEIPNHHDEVGLMRTSSDFRLLELMDGRGKV